MLSSRLLYYQRLAAATHRANHDKISLNEFVFTNMFS